MSATSSNGVRAPTWLLAARVLTALAFAALLGLFAGALGASGNPVVVLGLIGLVVVVLIISSRKAVFWFVLLGALVVTGVTQLYMPWSQARHVRYVVPLASLALLLHWVSERLAARAQAQPEAIPAPMVWAFAFALTGAVSVLVNLSDPIVALVGAKNYFQMWAFFLGVAFLRWEASFARNLMQGLLLIALLQVPFAAHQYLVLVPQRVGLGEGIVAADVVAGTFGATLLGGGANAVLTAFQLVVVACLLALWKNGAMSLPTAAAVSMVLLSPLLVNQAKIAALYLPLIFGVVFYRDIVARPVKFLMAGLGMAAAVGTLLTALTFADPAGRFQSWSDLVDYVVARQTADVHDRQGQYSELSRWSALTFWAERHVTANPANTLVGHGLGESREQEGGLDLALTLAEKHYPGLRIGTTAVSALLWDTGILGLVCVLAMFTSAFHMAGLLVRHYRGRDPYRAGLFEGLRAGIAVLTLSLAHKDFFVVNIPFQTFTYLLIGFIASTWLQVRREDREVRTG